MTAGERFRQSLRNPLQWAITCFILGIVGFAIVEPFDSRVETIVESPLMQGARSINLLLFQYATDNDGNYPMGHSSTEIFQKLIDEKYCDDPTIFYYKMPGKTPATSNKLKPENVCWDVTISVEEKDSDYLPVVYLTGYRLKFVAGGNAVPLNAAEVPVSGLGMAYKGNGAFFLKDDRLPDHIVPNVISPDFSSAGKTYQQLTPDGPLEP